MNQIKNIKTLEKCENIKVQLDELTNLLFFTVNQGISEKFNIKKEDLINWIEEIEFTINNYEQN